MRHHKIFNYRHINNKIVLLKPENTVCYYITEYARCVHTHTHIYINTLINNFKRMSSYLHINNYMFTLNIKDTQFSPGCELKL